MLEPSDSELLRAALAGEASGLGALIERHRASMRAVALRTLGHRPEAEDAVQDAVVVALARLGELREPTAVGPWLRAIVRNNCLMLRRQKRPLGEPLPEPAADEPNAEGLLERHALRNWTLSALEALSEPLQLVTLLRYFTGLTSYEDIAAFCGVPVGTVRSRLNEAKRKLGETLRATASGSSDALLERTIGRAREAAHLLAAADEGRFAQAATEFFDRDLQIVGPSRVWGTDLPFLVRVMESDRHDGVRQRLHNVVCGREVTIWEMDLLSPRTDPTHCPPSIVWAHFMADGRSRKLRLYYPSR